MNRRKTNHINEQLLEYLRNIKTPIIDEKRDLHIYLVDDRARSNQSRYEHIVRNDHRLTIRDIKMVFNDFNNIFKFRKDKKHKHTYSYYFKRPGKSSEYIKMCIYIDDEVKRTAKIKTIFITRNIK